ncbi:MAG: DUF167 domain-containing protein [Ignavibacteriota bacterium]
MARLTVKVHPRAKRVAHRWTIRGRLEARSGGPAVDGKANDECLHFFAELAGVARARVRIVTGATSRLKVVEIEGVEQSELENLL